MMWFEQDAFDTEDGTTHAGKELPVINNKFSNQTDSNHVCFKRHGNTTNWKCKTTS